MNYTYSNNFLNVFSNFKKVFFQSYIFIHTIYIPAGEAYDDIIYKNLKWLRIKLSFRKQKRNVKY